MCAGLDALFTRWPQIQDVLRWVGAAYLVYLGWRIFRSGEAQAAESRKPLTAIEAAGFQFLNPKAWVMTLTAAAMFLPKELGLLAACAYMVGIMAIVNLPCITVWALFGSSMRGFLAKPIQSKDLLDRLLDEIRSYAERKRGSVLVVAADADKSGRIRQTLDGAQAQFSGRLAPRALEPEKPLAPLKIRRTTA